MLSSVCYSDVVVDTGEKLYQITEGELIALEQILSRQAQTINELSITLDRQAQTITTLENTLTQQRQTIETLSTSFDEYAREERRARIRLGVSVGAASLGVGIIGGFLLAIIGG